jgi:hypothetical protein
MNRKESISLVLFLFCILAIPTLALPASAKDLNVPDAILIDYYNAGGQANVTLQSPIYALKSTSYGYATSMQFRFIHCEIPNSDVSFDNLLVYLGFPATDAAGNAIMNYQPYAAITTSSNYATFQKAFWYGTFIQFDAALYNTAWASLGTNTPSRNNIILVNNDVLNVDRHGNDVTVTLNEPQTINLPLYALFGAPASFTLPAFSLVNSVARTITQALQLWVCRLTI